MKSCSAVILAFFIGFTGCNDGIKEKPVSPPELVNEIDKIRLMDMRGQPLSLNQYAGKTIFIHFWATWCKPCIEEMPSINAAQDTLKNKDIIFLLASDETPEQIIEFKNNHDYKFDYVRIENSEEMNVQSLPTTYIFNAKGKRVFAESNSRKWNNKNNIDTLLKIINKNE